MVALRSAVRLVLLGAAAAAVSGQEIVWQSIGVPFQFNPGGFLAELSDVNRDGYRDWAVLGSGGHASAVVVLSGRDGSELRRDVGPNPHWYFNRLVAAGDVDGDGFLDYACRRCEHYPPWSDDVIEVRSGKDDRTIWSVSRPAARSYGRQIAGNLDVNGDGRPDLVMTNLRSVVEVFDHTGRRLYTVAGPRLAIGAMGDLNGDGCDEFVANHPGPADGRGAVSVYSGRDGRELVRGVGEQPRDFLGSGRAGGCGDVNGDGVLDFFGSNEGSLGPGSVRVFSGVDGSVIWSFRLQKGRLFGTAIAIRDLDLDGVNDMLVGSSLEPPNSFSGGTVFWFSLRDGREVTRIYPPGLPIGQSFFGAYHLAIGAPHPGSPYPVFMVPEWQYQPAGRLTMMRAVPPGVRNLGQPCAGTLSDVPVGGFVTVGDSAVRLHLSGAPPGTPALALLGLSSTTYNGVPLPLDLKSLGLSGCSLLTSIDAMALVRTGTAGNRRGYASIDVPFGHDPKGATRIHAQWWVAGTGASLNGAFTGAVSWVH